MTYSLEEIEDELRLLNGEYMKQMAAYETVAARIPWWIAPTVVVGAFPVGMVVTDPPTFADWMTPLFGCALGMHLVCVYIAIQVVVRRRLLDRDHDREWRRLRQERHIKRMAQLSEEA